jgi:hypothetical protein
MGPQNSWSLSHALRLAIKHHYIIEGALIVIVVVIGTLFWPKISTQSVAWSEYPGFLWWLNFLDIPKDIGRDSLVTNLTYWFVVLMSTAVIVQLLIRYKKVITTVHLGTASFRMVFVELFCYLVLIIGYYAWIYTVTGIISHDNQIRFGIDECLYFSAITFTTLGYGDFRPAEASRLFAATEGILGYLMMATFAALIWWWLGRQTTEKKTDPGSSDQSR